jgi:hypothetical protein
MGFQWFSPSGNMKQDVDYKLGYRKQLVRYKGTCFDFMLRLLVNSPVTQLV